MADVSGKIVREQGGSVLRVYSGGSLAVDSGGKVTNAGTQSITGGLEVTAGATAACIASSKLKLGADIAASGTNLGVFEIMDFGNGVKFFLARTQNAPSAAGSPGSLLIRLPSTGTPSSAVDFYIKRGDNDPASGNWVAFQTTASAG